MLLAIDIGNTNIVAGLFGGQDLLHTRRFATDPELPADHYAEGIEEALSRLDIPGERISGSIVASVAPPLTPVLIEACRSIAAVEPLVVETGMDAGVRICYDNPEMLGVDRVVNAAGAYAVFQRSVIVIDLGTATTFDYVSADGVFKGGAIAPGLRISAEALFERAAQLPRIDLNYPERVVGRNTVECMQSGIVAGYAGLIEGLVQRMRTESGDEPLVVATGGLAPVVAPHCTTIDAVEEHLTLSGLKYIYEIRSSG